jgi:hypothetical protein
LAAGGVTGVEAHLQQWAAIISKAASDCVAGVIEGAADRLTNLRMRAWDYRSKLAQLFDTCARLEVSFPDSSLNELLATPQKLLHSVDAQDRELGEILIIHALDLLYFWMYQPRAYSMWNALLKAITPEERQIIAQAQLVLGCQKEISQMFLDGLVGQRFSPPLAFYLERWEQYLARCQALFAKIESQPRPDHSRPGPDSIPR